MSDKPTQQTLFNLDPTPPPTKHSVRVPYKGSIDTRRKHYVFQLSEPLKYRDHVVRTHASYGTTQYVLASCSIYTIHKSVNIFPCDEQGVILDGEPLQGSLKGTNDPNEAMRNLGYPVHGKTFS